MYARETRESAPVATFNNPSAIDEMTRRQSADYGSIISHRLPEEKQEKQIETELSDKATSIPSDEEKTQTEKSECGIRKFLERISTEDLLLLFLIFLFLFDGNTENDFMIPILLFLILIS